MVQRTNNKKNRYNSSNTLNHLLFYSLIFVSLNCRSQYINFSQIVNSYLYLTPANIGNFQGIWRLSSNFRHSGNFENNLYNFSTLSFERNFYFYRQQIYSVGLLIITDNSNNFGFTSNELNLIGGHFFKLNNVSYINYGISFGINNKFLNLRKFTMPEQYDNSLGRFNINLDNKEKNNIFNIWYFTMSSGIQYTLNKTNYIFNFGTAFYNINYPTYKFSDNKNFISPRYSFHTIFNKTFYKFTIKTKFICMGDKFFKIYYFGNEFGYQLNHKLFLSSGFIIKKVSLMHFDAISHFINLKINNIKIGLSYDIALTSNPCFNPTFEIFISYIMPKLITKEKSYQCDIF